MKKHIYYIILVLVFLFINLSPVIMIWQGISIKLSELLNKYFNLISDIVITSVILSNVFYFEVFLTWVIIWIPIERHLGFKFPKNLLCLIYTIQLIILKIYSSININYRLEKIYFHFIIEAISMILEIIGMIIVLNICQKTYNFFEGLYSKILNKLISNENR